MTERKNGFILKAIRLFMTVISMAFLMIINSAVSAHKISKSPLPEDNSSAVNLGFEEKPGSTLPMDAVFVSETGAQVKLQDVIKGPTILTFVYYKCADECDLLLTSISKTLNVSSYKEGMEPSLLTISISEEETPADSAGAKKTAFEAMQKPYPADKWHFLTGSLNSIMKVTEAAGFRFIKKGNDFDHPVGLIVLSPQGKIVRYILGTDFLPADLTISLMEASTGTVGPTVARVLRFCFSYDPKARHLVFNTLQVSAVVIFSFLLLFIIYLTVSGMKRRRRGGN